MQRITRRGFRHLMSRITAEELTDFMDAFSDTKQIDSIDLSVLLAVIIGRAEVEMFGEE